ncbi:hypothetical protein CAEBREN_12296 [Caenorhabditis brenneri]|uniref:PAN-3 domain-containing protein n=1 Tax=Caenorhabditis brenneri TaxID=135651 RepID=G0PGY5_CAEBE|nr:hypothetical protein CAEBREN_12296 [Caenorhabditis brenneri]
MVIVWGEVNFWSGDPPKFAISWDECIQKCLELADCYIRQFSVPPSQNRTFGANLCTANGAMGLTGPYSEDEMTAISDYFIPQLKEEIDTTKYSYYGIWTDGTRTKVEDFQLTDNTLDAVTYNALLRKDSKFDQGDVCITSLSIFIHWMWFSNYDMKGLALSSSYYAMMKKKDEEKKKGT